MIVPAEKLTNKYINNAYL